MDLPRYKMPSSGVDAKVVYQLLHDELELGEFVVRVLDAYVRLIGRWKPQHEPCLVSTCIL
jgi:hypothetical protein